MQTVRNSGHRRGSFWRYSRRASCEAARQLLTDAVEKVVLPGDVCPLGYFDPAGMSRLLGLGRLIGGGNLDADATEVIASDLRQAMRAAGRVVARGFGAPGS